METIAIKIRKSKLEELNRICRQKNISKKEFCNQKVEEHLKSLNEKDKLILKVMLSLGRSDDKKESYKFEVSDEIHSKIKSICAENEIKDKDRFIYKYVSKIVLKALREEWIA